MKRIATGVEHTRRERIEPEFALTISRGSQSPPLPRHTQAKSEIGHGGPHWRANTRRFETCCSARWRNSRISGCWPEARLWMQSENIVDTWSSRSGPSTAAIEFCSSSQSLESGIKTLAERSNRFGRVDFDLLAESPSVTIEGLNGDQGIWWN